MTDEQWRAAWQLCESLTNASESEREVLLGSNSNPEIAAAVLAVLSERAEVAESELPTPSAAIGRYVLGKVIGQGGMALVYSAVDTELGRRVALKFLSQRAATSVSSTKLFILEAQAASALNHPNIVTVHEIVRSERGLAIAMELVDGVSLRQFCGTPLPLLDVLRYGLQMAQALSAAHAAGIIHRDIKPENVMVRGDGYVKVLDFGLAHVAPRSSGNLGANAADAPPGGTWRYMSPEQVTGQHLTSASDIFSLGLVLYEMCAGEHAFPAESPLLAAEAIATANPKPLSAKNKKFPPTLDRLILSMLSRRPESRPTADEVSRALEKSIESAATTEARKRGRRWVIAAVVFLLCLRGAIILWHYVAAERTPLLTQITSNESENRVTATALSADGQVLAYADPDGIFVHDIHSSDTRSLRSPPHFRVVKIGWLSGETNLLASGFDTFTLKPALWIVTTTHTQPILFRQGADNGTPSPDGTQVAFTIKNGSEIWLIGADGKSARQLIAGAPSDIFPVLFWSADGKRVLFQRRRYRPQVEESRKLAEYEGDYVFSYESADARSGKVLAASIMSGIKSACSLPDGRVFFTRWGLPGSRWTDNLWEVATNQATGAFMNEPRQVTHLSNLAKAFGLTASADGRQMAFIIESYEPDVWVGDLKQPGPRLVNSRRLTFDSKTDYPHSWTRDSQSVVFESDRGGSLDLFKQSIDERIPESITANPVEDEALPQVSPNGRWILYSAGKLWDKWKLMSSPLEGGQPVKLLDISGSDTQYRCPLHAGGSSCVLRETRGHQEFVFYELDPVKGKGRELGQCKWFPNFLNDWDVSPDGRVIAMPYHDLLRGRIRLVPLGGDGAERDVVVQGAGALRSVVWAADGHGWFASAETDAGDNLIYVDPDGHTHLLRETTNRTWAVPSPDGQHLAFVNDGVNSNVWMIKRF